VYEHAGVSVSREGDAVAHRRRIDVPASAASVITGAAANDALWVIAVKGSAVYRFPDDAGASTRVGLTSAPISSFAGRSEVVFGLHAVWTLAPARERGPRAAVVTRIDPVTARVASRLAAPASLFVGRITVT
jgi:hypothetical protein